jgi:hypothetical protein
MSTGQAGTGSEQGVESRFSMHLGLLQVQFTHKIQQFTPKSFILAGFGVI